MGLALLILFASSRLVLFFVGRHYRRPIRFGWFGAITFGVLVGMTGSLWIGSPDANGRGEIFDWWIFIPLFAASAASILGLDCPASRFVFLAVAWLTVVIVGAACVFAIHFYRGY